MLKQQCGSVWGRQEKVAWVTQQHQPQVQNRVRDLRDFGYDYEAMNCIRTLPHSAWRRPLQAKPQNQQVSHFGSGSRPGLQAGSGVVNKKGCAGTGVFLPRQYGAPPPESRKKTSKLLNPLIKLRFCLFSGYLIFVFVLKQVVLLQFWSQLRLSML